MTATGDQSATVNEKEIYEIKTLKRCKVRLLLKRNSVVLDDEVEFSETFRTVSGPKISY
jgi:hypothetical protein